MSGIPVVASAVEGIVDAVRDGETGFLLPADSPKAWVDKIFELSQWDHDTRLVFADKAQAVIQRVYNWERVARETAAVYRSNH